MLRQCIFEFISVHIKANVDNGGGTHNKPFFHRRGVHFICHLELLLKSSIQSYPDNSLDKLLVSDS